MDAASTIAAFASALTVWTLTAGVTPVRVAGVFTLGAIAWRTRRHLRTDPTVGVPRGIVQLSAGLALIAAADGGLRSMIDLEMSAVEAAGILIGYLLIIGALLHIVACRLPGREIDVMVEACLIGALVGLGTWAVAGRLLPDAAIADRVMLPTVVVMAADTASVVILLRLLTGNGRGLATYRYLNLGFAYVAGAHGLAGLSGLSVVEAPEFLITAIMVAGLVFIGLAAVVRSADLLVEPLALEPRLLSPIHLGLVLGGLLMAPAVLVIEAWRKSAVTASTATTTMITAGVLVAYVSALLVGRAETEHKSSHDSLTELPNRDLFGDRLDRALAHARRNDGRVGVLFLDLDHFKSVNDAFGHSAGDQLLVTVARKLERCIREEDTAARLGGDEFAVLLPFLEEDQDVIVVAERILETMAEPVTIAESALRMSVSIGVAVAPNDGGVPNAIVSSADAAMYRAKESGRNTYEVFRSELATVAHERLEIETALHLAIQRGELVLHYQPVLNARTGRTDHCEALVRWDHPESGLLFPGHFVPVAEQSDLVVHLGRWVLTEACRQAAGWHADGLGDAGIAVNVSARQFRHGLPELVAEVLRTTGLPPELLTIELTESAAVDSTELIAAALRDLREMGVSIAIDDFGTGYCGLRYLAELPLDAIKIDRSFVQGTSKQETSIVSASIAMAHNLGLRVVAEGIETEEQFRVLANQGCDLLQGFLFSKPVPPADIARRLALEYAAHAVGATAPPDVVDTPPTSDDALVGHGSPPGA